MGLKEIKVLMVISRFPPVVGGAERQCLNLSRFLAKKNHKITVATEKLKGLKSFEVVDGVRVLRLNSFPNSLRLLANLNFWANLKWLFLTKSSEFDIVHSHVATASAFFASILAKVFGKISIVKFTGSGITGEVTTSKVSFFGRLKLKVLDLLTDIVVCTDSKIKDELISVGYKKDKIRIMPNGVDIEYFKPLEPLSRLGGINNVTSRQQNNQPSTSVEGLDNGGTKVLFVGRLENVKNVPSLLLAWKKVISQTKAVLTIIGGGSRKDELIALMKELNITESVQLLGEKNLVKEYLDESDIFVLPSFAEGVSNSLLEAMSCGLGVIASRVGGSVDMVYDGVSGFLFEPNKIDELSEKLLKLIKDPVLRKTMGQKARETIVKKYSIESIGLEYIKLYDELLSLRGKA